MRSWPLPLGFIVAAGGWAMAGMGCGRSSTVPHRDAAEPLEAPFSSGGAVGTGGVPSPDGAAAAGGTGGIASGGASGTGGIAGGPCNAIAESNLPGVSFVFSDGPCSYTLAEVAAGISIDYELRIEQTLDGVHPASLDMGLCGTPDTSGLVVGFEISGNNWRYCLCDVGPCGLRRFSTRTVPGTYRDTIPWHGRSWLGPSDTRRPEGDAFPPGTYTVTLTTKGTWDGAGSCDAGACSADGGAGVPYQVTAKRSITLTP